MTDRGLPEEDPVAQWRRVSAGVSRTNQRIVDRIAHVGVQDSWFEVLNLLMQAPEHRLPMSHLAREVMMSSGGFTKLADRMAREGLIDRRGSADDRRVVYATLTPAGIGLAKRAIAEFGLALRDLVLGVVEEDELASLARTLGALADRYDAPTDDIPSEDEAATEAVNTRDPALPDRRRRGHEPS